MPGGTKPKAGTRRAEKYQDGEKKRRVEASESPGTRVLAGPARLRLKAPKAPNSNGALNRSDV
jgi:hypothetical protein